MEVDGEESSNLGDLLDLSDIQPPVIYSHPKYVDAIKSIDELRVCVDILEGDLSRDSCQGLYIEYLLY